MLYLDGKHVSHQQLIKELKIEEDVPKGKEGYTLRIHPNYTKFDTARGKFVHPTLSYKPHFHFRDKNGDQRELAYALRKPFENKDGDIEYGVRQHRLIARGSLRKTFRQDEYDLFLWFFLNPHCGSSPFADNRKVRYILEDREAEAEQVIQQSGKLKEALDLIENMDDTKLLRAAKGLKVSNVKSMYPVEAKAELTERAQNNPERFVADINDIKTTYRGLLYDAVDKSVIYQTTVAGVRKWFWQDGTEVCVIRKNSEPYHVLEEAMLDDVDNNISKIKRELKGKDVEGDLEEAGLGEGADLEEKVRELWELEGIDFNKAKGAWVWLNKDGEEDQEIVKVGNRLRKVPELVQHLQNDKKDASKVKQKHTNLSKKAQTA